MRMTRQQHKLVRSVGDDALVPSCRVCGAKVWKIVNGLVCDECTAKVIPIAIVKGESEVPINWAPIEEIKGLAWVAFSGLQPESLFEQNKRLAVHGERQQPLF